MPTLLADRREIDEIVWWTFQPAMSSVALNFGTRRLRRPKLDQPTRR